MDVWTIITPTGKVALPSSFSATQSEPGGVDTNALARRDDATDQHRTGDGLRTPQPFTLTGALFRDDPNELSSLLAELRSIGAAVQACTHLERSTNGIRREKLGVFAGGPTPEAAPDGLGGFRVTITLWPASLRPNNRMFVRGTTNTTIRTLPDGRPRGIWLPQEE